MAGHSAPAAVVIVTFDSPAGMLERCVAAVCATVPDSVGPIVVIDTGGLAVDRLSGVDDQRVDVVALGANVGFGAALAAGIERGLAQGAEVLIGLNDDVVVEAGWMEPLVSALGGDPRLGAVQPLLVQADVEPAVINSAGVAIDRYGAGEDRLRGRPPADAVSERVDVVTGGAAAWSARFVRAVGLPDPRFFLYYEDVEWCRRGAHHGWEFAVVTESRVAHAGSASTRELGDAVRRLQERNRLWAVVMHGGAAEVLRAVGLSVRRLRHPPRSVHVLALLGGVAGMPRRVVERVVGGTGRSPVARRPGPPRFVRAALGER